MSNGLGVNWSKKFHQKMLFPFLPHHKPQIERQLAGMSVNTEAPAQESYAEFCAFYLSFGVPLAGAKGDVTFTRARDAEKIAAGWIKNAEGILEAPNAAPPEPVLIDTDVPAVVPDQAKKDRKAELEKYTPRSLSVHAISILNISVPPDVLPKDLIASILDAEYPKTRAEREKEIKNLSAAKLQAIADSLNPPLTFDGEDWTNAKRVEAILDREFPAAPDGE